MSDGDRGRFVYVIGAQTGAQKIGISVAPSKRLAGIQLYSPIKLALHHDSSPSENAPLVERVAHKLLEEKRLHGEWFDVPIEEAVAAVERAIALVDAGDLSLLGIADDTNPGTERNLVTVSISLGDEDLLRRFDVMAKHEARTRSSQIALLMRRWVEGQQP